MIHSSLVLVPILALGAAALPPSTGDAPPPLPREFRGVWVATVANIDWPSKKGLPTAQQKKELLAILDRAADLKLNALVFQVRPMCDALYASDIEPWSEYLTGTLGKAPDPLYDPLEFAIHEAHARGLELHAWCNPFRAHHPSATSPIPNNHLVKQRPELAPKYGKHFWLNPTNPAAQDHSLRVFLDIVRRYDVDGIHIDDYFYPYKEKGADNKTIPFPDEDTWAAYQKSGGHQPFRRADVPGDQAAQAVGQGRHQPLRHLAARQPTRHRRAGSIRGTVCRRQALAQRRLGRLPHAAALLAHQARKAKLPAFTRVVGRREHKRAAPLAGEHFPSGGE
jgi:uncharacterized lipoprotein YddW (UPF0748 family)